MSESILSNQIQIADAAPFFDKVSTGIAAVKSSYLALIAVALLIVVIWHLIVLLNVDQYVPSPGNPTTNIDTAMIWNITATAILIGGLVLLTFDVNGVFKAIKRSTLSPKGSRFVSAEQLAGLKPISAVAPATTQVSTTSLFGPTPANFFQGSSSQTGFMGYPGFGPSAARGTVSQAAAPVNLSAEAVKQIAQEVAKNMTPTS